MLGGAATHFALAASFFDEVRPVGPVGDDFDEDELEVLRTRGTVTDDVEHVAGGKTFFWTGEYADNLNARETLAPTSTSSSTSSPSSRRPPRTATSCSWRTSSPSSSSPCASSAGARGSSRWTR